MGCLRTLGAQLPSLWIASSIDFRSKTVRQFDDREDVTLSCIATFDYFKIYFDISTKIKIDLNKNVKMSLCSATADDLALLQYWDEQPQVIASDPNYCCHQL